MRDKIHDIIVVGAGPIGSYTAYLLAKEGFDVIIFERNTSIGKNVNCTGIVSSECFRSFQLPSNIILRTIHTIKAFSPSGDYIRYQAKIPLAYVINRSLFDQEINKKATVEGAVTYLNTNVEKIFIKDEVFRIRVKSGRERCEFRSQVGIIATGFELNFLNGILKNPKNFLYGVQTDATMEDISDIEVYFGRDISPGSFGWVVPTSDKSTKIGLIAKKHPKYLLNKFLQNSLIRNRLNNYDSKIKCSLVPYGRIPKSYAERLIVVGEAAGQVKTTTGGGIYFGLLCAEIAAKTVIKAFQHGNFSEKLFKEYEKIWRSKVEPEIKAGIMLRNLFSRLSDKQIDLLLNIAKRDGIMPYISNHNFDWQRDIIFSISRHLISKKLFKK